MSPWAQLLFGYSGMSRGVGILWHRRPAILSLTVLPCQSDRRQWHRKWRDMCPLATRSQANDSQSCIRDSMFFLSRVVYLVLGMIVC